jgi:two-component system sensor histidine kinase YesM
VLIQKYLEIQRFTYDYEFKQEIEISEEVKDHPVLKNILQPIVENAIFHGLSRMGVEGELKIYGRKEDDSLKIEVIDNGIGIEEEQIENIYSGKSKKGYGGYGVYNVKKRIENYYGGSSSLIIKSTVGQGTIVQITIPFSREFE